MRPLLCFNRMRTKALALGRSAYSWMTASDIPAGMPPCRRLFSLRVEVWMAVFATINVYFGSQSLTFADERPATPGWWMQYQVAPAPPAIPPEGAAYDDERDVYENWAGSHYSPANVGQLMWMAKQARAHLEQLFPSGNFTGIDSVMSGWPEGSESDNYAPANQGQLKHVAKAFYDFLNGLSANAPHYTNLYLKDRISPLWTEDYPWTAAGGDNAHFSPVNLGQLKTAFGFDLSKDRDGDGLTDAQELAAGLDPGDTTTHSTTPDGWYVRNGSSNPTNPGGTPTYAGTGTTPPFAPNPEDDISLIELYVNPVSTTEDGYSFYTYAKAKLIWYTDNETSIDYKVERRLGSGNWHNIATVDGSVTESGEGTTWHYYVDNGPLEGGRQYEYRVSAIGASSNQSKWSNIASHIVPLVKYVKIKYNTTSGGMWELFQQYTSPTPPDLTQYYRTSTHNWSYSYTDNDGEPPDSSWDDSGSESLTYYIDGTYSDEYTGYVRQGLTWNWSGDGDGYYSPYLGAPSGPTTWSYSDGENPEFNDDWSLSDLFSRSQLRSAVAAISPIYPSTHQLVGFGGVYTSRGGLAYGTFSLGRMKYQFVFYDSNETFEWYEYYQNTDESYPGNAHKLGSMKSVSTSSGQSSEYTIDTNQTIGGSNESNIVVALVMRAGNTYSAYVGSQPSFVDENGSVLDEYNREHRMIRVSKNPGAAGFQFGGMYPLAAKYKLSWSSSNLTFVNSYTNATISSGANITLTNGWDNFLHAVVSENAEYGEIFHVTATVYDTDNNSLGTLEVDFIYEGPAYRFNISTDENAGARYRKVALNGRPLGDGKPQTESESDRPAEETFIDALTQGLRHSVTDVYMPLAGSDLVLSVLRTHKPEVWNDRNGLRPHERPDLPFGPGWDTNIAPNIRLETSDTLVHAYVTDENGSSYHFVCSTNGTVFVPYPTGQHEHRTYLTTLTRVGTSLVLIKKYGTIVVYDPVPALTRTISDDRLTGSDSTTSSSYYRTSSVTDRLGNKLVYEYQSGAYTLVPKTISAEGYEGATIYIHQDDFGRIDKIWDADYNEIRYTYTSQVVPDSVGASGNYSATLLETVATNGTAGNVTYVYELVNEADPRGSAGSTPPTAFHHCDLTDITDQNGETYTFDYDFHYQNGYGNATVGIFKYDSDFGYYAAPGRPRLVSAVGLPGNRTAHFGNDSYVKVVDGAGGALVLHEDTRRRVHVTDADSNHILYSWGNMTMQKLELAPELGGDPNSFSYTVQYGNMTVDYGPVGEVQRKEVFEFQPSAGMALKKVTDLSNKVTEYVYGDAWTAPGGYLTIIPNYSGNTGVYNFVDDPTQQINALSQSKYFAYKNDLAITRNVTYGGSNTFNATLSPRLMKSVTNEAGQFTEYTFDGQGRRTDEKRYATFNGTLLQHTQFAYGNATFPGVVTTTTTKTLEGDPAWAADLVVENTLDAAGRVKTKTVDPGGLALATHYTYSPAGDLLSTTDPKGQVTTFFYDARHRLTRVVNPDGSEKSFGYDNRGNKKRETDENGHSTLWEYDELNRVTDTGRDMDGNNILSRANGDFVTTYTYSDTGARLSVTDPEGNRTDYEYDDLNRLETMSTPEVPIDGGSASAIVTTYLYEPAKNPGGSAFDSSGFKPTKITREWGNTSYTTDITYDALYRPLTEVVGYGAGNATTTKVYDDAGNLWKVTDPGNMLTETLYDGLNRPTNITVAKGAGAGVEATMEKRYTATGFLYEVEDAYGRVTATEYDAAGRPIMVTQPAVTGGSPVTETEYDANGNVVRTINPLNEIWDFEYDSRNRRVRETQPAVTDATTGGVVRPSVLTHYDAAGNVRSVTDARGGTTVTFYDEANRPVNVFGPPVDMWIGGNLASGQRPGTQMIYDRNGNVMEVWHGHVDEPAAGEMAIARQDAVNVYDALNRLVSTTDAKGIEVTYGYDGGNNRTRVTDGLSQTTVLAYDGLNRLLTTTAPGEGSPYETNVYDAVNKTSRTDGNGNVTTYGYDAQHRLTSATYANVTSGESSGRAYFYDLVGNLLGVTETYSGTASDVSNVAYGYDALNRMTVENQGGAHSGNLTRSDNALPPEVSGGIKHQYTYDVAGNRLTAVYNAGGGDALTLTSSYDALNRLAGVTDGTRTSSYGYDAAGGRVRLEQGDGMVVSTGYDLLGRQVAVGGATWNGVQRYGFALAYDEYGNLARQVESYPGNQLGYTARTLSLGYDEANRLTSENAVAGAGNVTTTYAYDDAHNRISRTVVNGNVTTVRRYVYTQSESNQLNYAYDDLNSNGELDINDEDSTWYGYDANGNRELRYLLAAGAGLPTWSDIYAYDRENRLTGLKRYSAFGVVQSDYKYAYDYRTRRVVRDESAAGGNVTSVIFSGGTSVREYAVSGNTSTLNAQYVRGSDWGGGVGGILYSLRTVSANTTPYYYHYDGRGDVVAESTAQALTYLAAYEAFGRHSESDSPATKEWTSAAGTARQRANTKDEDPTGLLNEGFRYRDLDTGAFLTRDPLGFVDGPNLYAYCVQNPWSKFDPEGLLWEEVGMFFGEMGNQALGIGERVNNTMAEVGYTLTDMAYMATDIGFSGQGEVDMSRPAFSQTFSGGERTTSTFAGLGIGPEFDAGAVLATTQATASVGTMGAYNAAMGGVNMAQGNYEGAQDQFLTATLIGAGGVRSTNVGGGKPASGTAAAATETANAANAATKAGAAGEAAAPSATAVYPRVKLSKGTRSEIWERSKAPDGKVYDPTGREIKPGEPWEAGHKPEHKFSNGQQRAANEQWDSQTWKQYQRDPDIYRPERPTTNASHAHE